MADWNPRTEEADRSSRRAASRFSENPASTRRSFIAAYAAWTSKRRRAAFSPSSGKAAMIRSITFGPATRCPFSTRETAD